MAYDTIRNGVTKNGPNLLPTKLKFRVTLTPTSSHNYNILLINTLEYQQDKQWHEIIVVDIMYYLFISR